MPPVPPDHPGKRLGRHALSREEKMAIVHVEPHGEIALIRLDNSVANAINPQFITYFHHSMILKGLD